MSNFKKHLLFVKTFPRGGLNNLYEELIKSLRFKRKYHIDILVIDYRKIGIDLPTTKSKHFLFENALPSYLPFKFMRYLYLFSKIKTISLRLQGIIDKISPDVVIWSQDTVFHIPPIPDIKKRQIFLFQEWLREKYEYKASYYSFKHPKRSLWNLIRSVILSSNKRFLSHIDTTVFHTTKMRNLCRSVRYPLHKTTIIPIGIDTGKFVHLNTLKQTDAIVKILYLGPLAHFKGSNLMTNALFLLLKFMDRKEIIFQNISYKKGRDFQETRTKLEKGSIKFEFFENISDKKKIKLINEADLVLHVPHDEPYGLTILEALSCGTKVIAYKRVGVLEHFKLHQPGLFVLEEYDSLKLALLMNKALKTKVTGSLIRRVFLKQNLNMRHFVKRLESVL